MAKTCPSCGFLTPDDQAVYCNKCGYPFPKAPSVKPPVTRISGEPVSRAPRQTPVRRRARKAGFLSFGTLIGRRYLKQIYLLGAVIIIIAAVMGIAGLFAKPGPAAKNASFTAGLTNTTALGQDPAGSSLFWIGFLVAGSVLWRLFCELCVAIFRLDEAVQSSGELSLGYEDPEYAEDISGSSDAYAQGQDVVCPHCGKIVPADDLRECEHCGVQGCSNCIRQMGLLKKSLTCRSCFEEK